jgi:hypothetical protein
MDIELLPHYQISSNFANVEAFRTAASGLVEKFVALCAENNLPPTYDFFTIWMKFANEIYT